jgi:hypothetical protein
LLNSKARKQNRIKQDSNSGENSKINKEQRRCKDDAARRIKHQQAADMRNAEAMAKIMLENGDLKTLIDSLNIEINRLTQEAFFRSLPPPPSFQDDEIGGILPKDALVYSGQLSQGGVKTLGDIRGQEVAKQVLAVSSYLQNSVSEKVLPGAESVGSNQVAQIAQRKEKSQDESTSDIRVQDVEKQVQRLLFTCRTVHQIMFCRLQSWLSRTK